MIKNIDSLIEELDFNSLENASQMDKNKIICKLLEETQKNEVRIVQDRIQEKIKLENEKNNLQVKVLEMDEIIRQQQQLIDQLRGMNKLIEQERIDNKETIYLLENKLSELKLQLISNINEFEQKQQEYTILNEKHQLGEIINQKYIKEGQKSRIKQKALKLQMKQQFQAIKKQNEEGGDTDLVQSLKTMVNCQQCKKKLKEAILTKCLHMFCKSCLEDNLKNRNRACSICRTRYGQEDVKVIKFT